MRLFQRERRDATVDAMVAASGRRLSTSSGVPVNEAIALTLPAVWGCVDLLAELVSTLPVDEYRKVNGVRILQPTPPLLDDPARDGTGVEVWLRQAMHSGLLRGNVYGLILGLGSDGWPVQIESLHPDRVTWRRQKTFGPVESYLDNNEIERWPLGPLWHVPIHATPGSPIGMSPLAYAAETIGLGLGANRYAAGWFNGGGLPIATLESDQVIDKPAAEALSERISESLVPGRPLVLGAGLKLNAIQVEPQDLQFLETIKANADDVAKFFFRRPPGEGGSVTYANVESRSLDLLTYTLIGWMVRLEKSMTRLRPRPRYVKFNEKALLRTDALTSAKVADVLVRSGLRSRDELREKDDYAPIPDGSGSEFLWPPYATTLGGDASDGSSQLAATGT
jgi:HK97 family phage portal protein